jgi:hypothetical protein
MLSRTESGRTKAGPHRSSLLLDKEQEGVRHHIIQVSLHGQPKVGVYHVSVHFIFKVISLRAYLDRQLGGIHLLE